MLQSAHALLFNESRSHFTCSYAPNSKSAVNSMELQVQTSSPCDLTGKNLLKKRFQGGRRMSNSSAAETPNYMKKDRGSCYS
jgi:hypothetical protein